MRYVTLTLVLSALAACSEPSERSYTVDELMADEGLLTATIEKCRENPGELGGSANSRNVEAADGKLRLERMRQSLGG